MSGLASSLTVAELLQELERERTAIDLVIRGIGGYVDRLEAKRAVTDADAPAPPAQLPPARSTTRRAQPVKKAARKPPRKPSSGRSRLSDEAWADIERRRGKGEAVKDLATAFGISAAAIYARFAPRKDRTKAKGTAGVLRRCRNCGQRTSTDPCQHCFEHP